MSNTVKLISHEKNNESINESMIRMDRQNKTTVKCSCRPKNLHLIKRRTNFPALGSVERLLIHTNRTNGEYQLLT